MAERFLEPEELEEAVPVDPDAAPKGLDGAVSLAAAAAESGEAPTVLAAAHTKMPAAPERAESSAAPAAAESAPAMAAQAPDPAVVVEELVEPAAAAKAAFMRSRSRTLGIAALALNSISRLKSSLAFPMNHHTFKAGFQRALQRTLSSSLM